MIYNTRYFDHAYLCYLLPSFVICPQVRNMTSGIHTRVIAIRKKKQDIEVSMTCRMLVVVVVTNNVILLFVVCAAQENARSKQEDARNL